MHCLDRRTRLALRASAIVALAGVSGTPAHAVAPAPDASPAADCLFNWVESQYPALFAPAGATSRIRDGDYYRDYAESGTRLSAGTGRLWMLARNAVAVSEAGPLREWFALSGCQMGDTIAPTVLYTSRSDGAVEVARNARIAAAFSEPIDAGKLSDAITVTRDDGRRVQGTARYDAAAAALHFEPSGEFDGGRRYTVTLSTQIRDLAGNPLAAPYSWQFHTTTATTRNTEVEHQLQWVLDRALWRNDIPGATMALLRPDGSLWTTSSGYSDLTTRSAMSNDRLLRIGSNTKTFVATAVLQLVDAGIVDLDAPINNWLSSELSNYLPAYDGNVITVRHLLNHTSGIINFTEDPEWGAAFISDPTKRYFPQELLLIANRNVTAANYRLPGQFSYSNTNYVLLGMLLGNAGSLVYDDAIRLRITAPLGLHNTLVPTIGDAVPPPQTSRGYWEDTETRTLHDVTIKDPSTVWSSGDMIADIADLARWGQVLGKGSLLSPASQAARLSFVDMTPNLEYGLGIVRDKSANLLGHQGGIIGYTSQMYYVADEDATLAFFYNRTLAMSDYSIVMTYDALKLLWPERYRWFVTHPVESQPQVHRAASPRTVPIAPRTPGFLNEY